MSELKHTTVRTFTQHEDGSVVTETKSYHDEPVMFRKEVTTSIKTSNGTLLSDIISCLDVLKGEGTPELVITVLCNEHNLPTLIKKTYTLEKEVLNRKRKHST